MDIIITKVYDECRFKHYLRFIFRIYSPIAISTIHSINNGNSLRLNNIPECEIRYLQGKLDSCNNIPKICKLKIVS